MVRKDAGGEIIRTEKRREGWRQADRELSGKAGTEENRDSYLECIIATLGGD